MAVASRLRREVTDQSGSGKKTKKKKSDTDKLGFWSRFMNRSRRKKMELEAVLTHSRTVVVQRNVHG